MRTSLAHAGIMFGSMMYNPNHVPHHLISTTTYQKHQSIIHSKKRLSCLHAKSQDNDNLKKPKPNDGIDPVIILPSITIACIAILILWVLNAKLSNPNAYFDVDFYMALDGIIGNPGSDTVDSPESIVGLPPLSPAEQLVGAIFGPPSR